MQHSQRLDRRLRMLREEVRTMTQEKERGERVWRDRLQRCQRQLKAKEDEMSRQSQYFENFKTQLQHKLNLAWDREQSLQNQIYTLEKQLLDMTVSLATRTTTISAVRITAARTATQWEAHKRLPSMRGEGEGEEERKEDRRKQWQPNVGTERAGGREGDEGPTAIQGGRDKETKQNSNEAKLQSFIQSLQEDLRVLLEREENGMTVQRGLREQLQEAQENSQFLGCKVEEIKAQAEQLKLSESSLMEEVEELREENHRLQQILKDTANRTCSQVCSDSDKRMNRLHSSAVPPVCQHASAENTQNKQDHSPAKSVIPCKNVSHHWGSKTNPSLQQLSLTTETLDEFKLGTWCSSGTLNLEESPSQESDALKEAYISLGFGEDQEHCDALEDTLLDKQLNDNTRLDLQVREEAEEKKMAMKQGPLMDDLVQALNQENWALAGQIQELLAYIAVREEEIKMEETQLRGHISMLEADKARLEQENQEQGCLITELTKKTEDDLNTIMELQQSLAEVQQHQEASQVAEELCESQREHTATVAGCFKGSNEEEDVDNLGDGVIKGREVQMMSSQGSDMSTTASAHGYHQENQCIPLHNSLQSSLHLGVLTDPVDKLTKSVQSLKMEQEELSDSINSLREQQREVALSIQTQTEVKQQETRTVWGLKEDKDNISQSLVVLKQQREQLSKEVLGLKDERDQILRSASRLTEEKEELTKALFLFKTEKEKLLESLSSGKIERDQIMCLLQSLNSERDHLSQAVLSLKQEREEVTTSLKCLKEQRDREQSSYTLEADCDKLQKLVSTLREEKERIEFSIAGLKQEQEQVKLLQGLREERNSHKEKRDQMQHLLNANSVVSTKTLVGTGEYAAQRCQTKDHRGNTVQEQSDLKREIEALGDELKRLKDELEKEHADTKGLHSELRHSEAWREEAERKAAQASAEVTRLTDVASQLEDTRNENQSLIRQVTELQSELTVLRREKTDALSLKARIEELYNILTAQLKAKTMALEELNSEYIALKQGPGSTDVSAPPVSLRTRCNDIRAKKSQEDLDMTQLKAKLSCLVAKCQERNSLLVQLMKAMQRQGSVDPTLTQQVEQLLSDAALHDHTAAFTPGRNTLDHCTEFTPGFMSELQSYTSRFTPDQTGSTTFTPVNQQDSNSFSPESGVKGRGHTSVIATESKTNKKGCTSEITLAPTETLKRTANSPVPASPAQEHASDRVTPSPVIPALNEGFNTALLSPSVDGPVQAASRNENLGFHQGDMKGKSSPDLSSSPGFPLSPAPPSPSTCVSPSRRLSSPEKIINLHEQLQKTLMSSSQTPVSRGRGQEPRNSLYFSAPTDLGPASQIQKQSLIFCVPCISTLPVTSAPSWAKNAVTPTTNNKSATLFNAVALRSASVTFNPRTFTSHPTMSATMSALSSSSNYAIATVAPSKVKSTSSSGANLTQSQQLTRKLTAIPDVSHAPRPASFPLTLVTSTFDSDILVCADKNSECTASDTTAPETKNFNMPCQTNCAAPAHDGLAMFTPKTSDKFVRKSAMTMRPKPEAPAEVRSVEVIKTVGQSSLMIGWERPPLDELGCSNGTFVYGYRVFVGGDFHKSVMSSACTKCILENLDLSVPVCISVQTLGSNGLSSDGVHTMYRTDNH